MIRVKNDANGAEIYITGDIVDDADGDVIKEWFDDDVNGYQWPAAIKNQLDSIDDDAPLTVYINSDGGSVPAGVAIANMIARHKGETTAVVDGWCCSIATQIFFAADHRVIPENAYLMIHKPSTVAYGDANELTQAVNALDVIQQGLESTYNKHTKAGTTVEDVHEMVENTTWLTGKDAAELFDVETTEATQTAACAGGACKSFKNIPNIIKASLVHDGHVKEDAHKEKAVNVPKGDKAEDVQDTDDSLKKQVKLALELAKA